MNDKLDILKIKQRSESFILGERGTLDRDTQDAHEQILELCEYIEELIKLKNK